ncbi:MAG: hypothetical protein ABFQ62_00585 [Patescibacteria group bacterium]
MPTTVSKKKYPHHRFKIGLMVFALSVLFLITLGLLYLQLRQLQNRQDITSKASSQLAQIKWGDVSNQSENQDFNIPILINSQQYSFSAIQIKGKLYNIAADKVTIIPHNPSGLNSVISKLEPENGATAFTLIYFSDIAGSSLFSTVNQDVKLADLSISDLSAGNYSVHLDVASSMITSFLYPNLSLEASADRSFTVSHLQVGGSDNNKKNCNQNCATDTECKSEFICYKGRCRSDEDKEDVNCVLTSDDGINRDCDEYCADSSECNSELNCYYNRCRNPLNLLSEACASPTPRPTLSPTTYDGKGGTSADSSTPKPTSIAATKLIIDGQEYGKNASAATALKTSPSPSPRASVTPRPSPSLRPSPSPTIRPALKPESQVFEEEKSSNWLGIFILVAIVGVIGIAGFMAFINWKPKADSF